MQDLFVDPNIPEPLSQKEVLELFQKKAKGDYKARNMLIEHNIRLVINIVIKKYFATSCNMTELVSVGLIGLIKSVDTFDVTKGINFSTYAVRCIENEILYFLRVSKKYMYDASLEDIILNDEEGNDLKVENMLSDSNSDFVLDYENKEVYKIIREIVSTLPETHRQVVEKFFGFYDNKPMSQRAIARELGVSQTTISRILSKALKKISFILKEQAIVESLPQNVNYQDKNGSTRKRKKQ